MKNSQNKPVVAIDVDGVLRNNLGIMLKLYNEEFGVNMTENDIVDFKTDISFPLIEERYHMPSSEWFFQLHAKEIFLDAPAFKGVTKDIVDLKEVADIVIVTYQKGYRNKMFTLQWLEKHGIDANEICFLRDKTKLHTDVLIDDNWWNFWGTNVDSAFLVDAPHNRQFDTEELVKMGNSNEMYRVASFHEFARRFIAGQKLKAQVAEKENGE